MESVAVILGGVALGALLWDQGGKTGAAAGIASGTVLTLSLAALTSRQREQEFEADRVSLDLLRRAGYPTKTALDFWDRYATHRAGHGLGRGGWWKGHPPDAERVRRLRQLTSQP